MSNGQIDSVYRAGRFRSIRWRSGSVSKQELLSGRWQTLRRLSSGQAVIITELLQEPAPYTKSSAAANNNDQ